MYLGEIAWGSLFDLIPIYAGVCLDIFVSEGLLTRNNNFGVGEKWLRLAWLGRLIEGLGCKRGSD